MTGSDRLWALAFATPYVLIFFAFVIYPICYGLWLGSDPAEQEAEEAVARIKAIFERFKIALDPRRRWSLD